MMVSNIQLYIIIKTKITENSTASSSDIRFFSIFIFFPGSFMTILTADEARDAATVPCHRSSE